MIAAARSRKGVGAGPHRQRGAGPSPNRGFVCSFALFQPTDALDSVELHTNAEFSSEVTAASWVQAAQDRVSNVKVVMRWGQMQSSFAVRQSAAESATSAHEMLSIFRPAARAGVTVDGIPLPRAAVERDFFGSPAPSAGLALSESWVQA